MPDAASRPSNSGEKKSIDDEITEGLEVEGHSSSVNKITKLGCLFLISAALVSCQSNSLVGDPCELPLNSGGGEQAEVFSPSLDCQSRTCLYLPPLNSVLAAATPDIHTLQPKLEGMCTEQCVADEDCEGTRDSTCSTGFACAVPLTTGPFCCRRMCVCKGSLEDLSIPAECDVSNPVNTCSNLPGR